VLISRLAKQVGTYADGARASRNSATITIVDLAEKRVLCTRTFAGGAPPATKVGAGDRSGASPWPAAVDFLYSLPRE
jgi:hypothetical protein